MSEAKYYVDGVGTVGIKNAVFTMWCRELPKVLRLKEGESADIKFKSGLGESVARVERLETKD